MFLECLKQLSLFQKDWDEIAASPFTVKNTCKMSDSQLIIQSQSIADHQSSPLRCPKKGGKEYRVTVIVYLLFINCTLSACNLLYVFINNPLEGRKYKATNFFYIFSNQNFLKTLKCLSYRCRDFWKIISIESMVNNPDRPFKSFGFPLPSSFTSGRQYEISHVWQNERQHVCLYSPWFSQEHRNLYNNSKIYAIWFLFYLLICYCCHAQ